MIFADLRIMDIFLLVAVLAPLVLGLGIFLMRKAMGVFLLTFSFAVAIASGVLVEIVTGAWPLGMCAGVLGYVSFWWLVVRFLHT